MVFETVRKNYCLGGFLIETEVWKNIEGYNGIYQVSDYGNVRSTNYKMTQTTRNLKQFHDGRAYMKVKLCRYGQERTVAVHRLVATTFLENPDGKEEVNHIDGNTLNNNLSNLEWVTPKENMKHAYRIGHITIPKIREVDQYSIDGKFIKHWVNIRTAAITLGVDPSAITKCCRGRLKKTGGFVWRYTYE